jgi:hypothetical protein
VFKNNVLRRIFRPKRDEVIEDWRKLHTEELHSLYTAENMIRVTKSRKWAEHVARRRKMINVYKILDKNLNERGHWEDILLKRILRKQDLCVWIGFIWLITVTCSGPF